MQARSVASPKIGDLAASPRGCERTQDPDDNETSHSAVADNSPETAGREIRLRYSGGGRRPPPHGRRAGHMFPIRRTGSTGRRHYGDRANDLFTRGAGRPSRAYVIAKNTRMRSFSARPTRPVSRSAACSQPARASVCSPADPSQRGEIRRRRAALGLMRCSAAPAARRSVNLPR